MLQNLRDFTYFHLDQKYLAYFVRAFFFIVSNKQMVFSSAEFASDLILAGISLNKIKGSLKSAEIWLLCLSFHFIKAKETSHGIFLATWLHWIFEKEQMNIILLIADDLRILLASGIFSFFRTNLLNIINLAALGLCCVLLQMAAGILSSNNIRRKIFHFMTLAAALVLPMDFWQLVLKKFLLLCAALSTSSFPTLWFKMFTSEKDYGPVVLSHLFLAGSALYPSYFLSRPDYFNTLISICIMDSFASFAGQLLKRRAKSIEGLLFGQFASYIAEYFLHKKISYRYHIFMGTVEYISPINDNIAIPLASILYFKYLKFC
ncbi:hypothetical protein ENBRE01_0941 [Enteropsectra breve]|nr:hypothetical protein ENBRE01_0941 [Enteropsectra breve]